MWDNSWCECVHFCLFVDKGVYVCVSLMHMQYESLRALLNAYMHVSVHLCMYMCSIHCICACPSLGVYINEHLSVSLMPYSIRPPILCVQLIARTSAGVCVFLTLANRSMALHTNVPLHQPHPCQSCAHTLLNDIFWFNFQVDTLIQSKLTKGQQVEKACKVL